MKRAASFMALAFVAILAVTLLAGAQTPSRAAPTVRPAIDGILAAFEKHPLFGNCSHIVPKNRWRHSQ